MTSTNRNISIQADKKGYPTFGQKRWETPINTAWYAQTCVQTARDLTPFNTPVSRFVQRRTVITFQ